MMMMMMMMMRSVLCISGCVCVRAAIKCFVCDSSDNKSCANLKSNASIVAEVHNLMRTYQKYCEEILAIAQQISRWLELVRWQEFLSLLPGNVFGIRPLRKAYADIHLHARQTALKRKTAARELRFNGLFRSLPIN
uniref:Secreted protein n=1 Tax=Glossina austeni TaxID=7395 RepID=A0A1A9VHS5_GLOAU